MRLSKREKGSLRGRGSSGGEGRTQTPSKGQRPQSSTRPRKPAKSLPAQLFAGFRALLGVIAAMLTGLDRLARRGLGSLERRTAGARRRFGTWVGAASRAATPARVLLIAAIGCAVLLGLSQFADYRGVAIGVDDYDPAIEAVAPAPEVDRAELGSAHSYLMLPAAIVAIFILLIAARSGRWQLCRLPALIGIAAIVVSIVVDRPAGLDEGTLARDFTGVEARLLGGFWVQVAAGVGLLLTSLLFASELRRARSEGSGAGVGRSRTKARDRGRSRAKARDGGATRAKARDGGATGAKARDGGGSGASGRAGRRAGRGPRTPSRGRGASSPDADTEGAGA